MVVVPVLPGGAHAHKTNGPCRISMRPFWRAPYRTLRSHDVLLSCQAHDSCAWRPYVIVCGVSCNHDHSGERSARITPDHRAFGYGMVIRVTAFHGMKVQVARWLRP